MTSARRHPRSEDGFLLVELLTTMAVFSIFIAAVALVFSGAIRSSTQSSDQAVFQTEARAAVDQMASELREGYADATLPSNLWLKTMTGTQLTFYVPDKLTPFHLRQVSYQLSGGKLQRAFATSTNTGAGPWVVGGTALSSATLGAWSTEVSNITNATPFTYLDANGNATAVAANVARVQVTVTVAPTGGQGKSSTYTISAGPRF